MRQQQYTLLKYVPVNYIHVLARIMNLILVGTYYLIEVLNKQLEQ